MIGKRILLGVTGGIAAYKITFLIRILKKSGAEVKCIMSPSAVDFVSPLVLSTLSENPVSIEFWNKENGIWNNHVDLASWADVFVIAPATLNTISKMANGNSDNLLLTTYFSMKGQTIVAPAMDLDMYKHPSFKRNLNQLVSDGVMVIPSTHGELASGLVGEGRMEEPEIISDYISFFFKSQKNKCETNKFPNILITAGPTFEKIDPVRYIGNYSSGKMGFEIAKEFLNKGSLVTLISGPTNCYLKHPDLTLINVESAEDMMNEVKINWSKNDLGIFAAAVADYKIVNPKEEKIKKSSDSLILELTKNPDILDWASKNRKGKQKVVGFALETNNSFKNALLKLEKKKLDIIILNSMENKGAGFQHDTNQISIISKDKSLTEFPLKSKSDVAEDIVHYIYMNL